MQLQRISFRCHLYRLHNQFKLQSFFFDKQLYLTGLTQFSHLTRFRLEHSILQRRNRSYEIKQWWVTSTAAIDTSKVHRKYV